MKLRLRIGRQRDRAEESEDGQELRTAVGTTAHAPMPSPRTPDSRTSDRRASDRRTSDRRASDRRVVRAGSFCRVGDIGRTAVTETGRAVVAVPAGRCGRWVYAENA